MFLTEGVIQSSSWHDCTQTHPAVLGSGQSRSPHSHVLKHGMFIFFKWNVCDKKCYNFVSCELLMIKVDPKVSPCDMLTKLHKLSNQCDCRKSTSMLIVLY